MKEDFDDLVRNGLDFLHSSISQLEEGRSKYAVIHFFTALEIILKARLLIEDWTLCVTNHQKTSLEEFRRGESNTVGLRDALKRMAELPNGKWDASETAVFESLRRRRNQAVHFFHPEHLGGTEKVAVEQLVGWNLLFRRLRNAWREQFESFSDDIDALNQIMGQRADYFPEVFKQLQTEITKDAMTNHLATCPDCRQRASLSEKELIDGVFRMRCRVCESEQVSVFLPCRTPSCNCLAERTFQQASNCPACGLAHETNAEESFNYFGKVNSNLVPVAWCGTCGYTPEQSVVILEDGCLCLACHAFLDRWQLNHCDWCNSDVTGNVGDSLNPGCVCCHHYLCYEDIGEEAPEFLYDREAWASHRQWIEDERRWK